MKRKMNLLIDERPLIVLPHLAIELGSLEQAIVLQQIHFLLNLPNSGIEEDGEHWVYGTYEQWCEDYFPFWSSRTLAKHIRMLEDSGYIISTQIKASDWDRTKYYRINYEKFFLIDDTQTCTIDSTQTRTIDSTQTCRFINKETETTTETTTERGYARPQNREHRRAQSNVSEAAHVGMDVQHLREWTDWILELAGQLALVDADDYDDKRLGKAQQTAIKIWRLGFTEREQLDILQERLEAKWQRPWYPGNIELAAGEIVQGIPAPTKGRDEVPASIRSLYNVAMED